MLSLDSATTSSAATPRATLVGKFGKPAQTKKTLIFAAPISATPVYEVFAIATPLFRTSPVNALIAGADPQHKPSIAMTVWLIRSHGRNTLVDSGFYRPQYQWCGFPGFPESAMIRIYPR